MATEKFTYCDILEHINLLIIYIYIKWRMVDDAGDSTWIRKIESILEAKIQKDQWGSTELIIDADGNIEGLIW